MKFFIEKSFFLNICLAIVLLFEGKFSIPSEIKIPPKNFAELNFVKCNNPDHSHPPISQTKKTITIEKICESGFKFSYLFDEKRNYFEISEVSHQNSNEFLPKFLFSHSRPSRAPPFYEV